jgi:aryl-alcohol dehydrogenase-like predicted oxidoreductase
MQLAGPGVFGPPRDPHAARAVLRRAIELGVDHIDTAQYYGPDVVNDLIRETLYLYRENLKVVTKVDGRRDDQAASYFAPSMPLKSAIRWPPPTSDATAAQTVASAARVASSAGA